MLHRYRFPLSGSGANGFDDMPCINDEVLDMDHDSPLVLVKMNGGCAKLGTEPMKISDYMLRSSLWDAASPGLLTAVEVPKAPASKQFSGFDVPTSLLPLGTKSRLAWDQGEEYHQEQVPQKPPLEPIQFGPWLAGALGVLHESTYESAIGGKHTTMMMKHIPPKYTQWQLQHEVHEAGFQGSYDFFYLPQRKKHTNRGFAFINLLSAELAQRFRETFHGTYLRRSPPEAGEPPIVVLPAESQGFDANARRHLDHQQHRLLQPKRGSTSKPVFFRSLPPATSLPAALAPTTPSRKVSTDVDEQQASYCARCGGKRSAFHSYCPYCGIMF